MNNAFKSLLFLALLFFTSTTNATPVFPVVANSSQPDFMTFLNVVPGAGGSADISWLSSIDGPYIVTVEDAATNQIVYFNPGTYDNSDNAPGLVAGTKYLVTVSDAENAIDQVFIF